MDGAKNSSISSEFHYCRVSQASEIDLDTPSPFNEMGENVSLKLSQITTNSLPWIT